MGSVTAQRCHKLYLRPFVVSSMGSVTAQRCHKLYLRTFVVSSMGSATAEHYIMSLSGLAGLVKCNCFQNKKLYQNDILAQEQNGW